MARYSFKCEKCDKIIELCFSMNDTEGRDNATCPDCGEKVKRVYEAPSAIVKSKAPNLLKGHQAMVETDAGPVRLNFVDHKRDSGLEDNSVLKSIPGAKMDEKTGKPVIEVVSSIPDPLGAANKHKEKITKEVKQKVKRRK